MPIPESSGSRRPVFTGRACDPRSIGRPTTEASMSRRRMGGLILASVSLSLSLSVMSCGDQKATAPAAGKELDSPYLLGASTGSANYIHMFASEGTYPYHCTLH